MYTHHMVQELYMCQCYMMMNHNLSWVNASKRTNVVSMSINDVSSAQ